MMSESVCGYGRGRGRGHGQRLAGYDHGVRGHGRGRGTGSASIPQAEGAVGYQQERPQTESKMISLLCPLALILFQLIMSVSSSDRQI